MIKIEETMINAAVQIGVDGEASLKSIFRRNSGVISRKIDCKIARNWLTHLAKSSVVQIELSECHTFELNEGKREVRSLSLANRERAKMGCC